MDRNEIVKILTKHADVIIPEQFVTGLYTRNFGKVADEIIASLSPKEEEKVKEIRASELLKKMMSADEDLYERILDTPGFAYSFNELVKLASK